MLRFFLLLLVSSVWARYEELSTLSSANVVPPGMATLPLNPSGYFLIPQIVGTPPVVSGVGFYVLTTTPSMIASVSLASFTYVPTGQTGNISSLQLTDQKLSAQGPTAYEYFQFGGLLAQGQGFLNAPTTPSSFSVLGIGFKGSETNSLDFPSVLDTLYGQGQITNKIMSFAFYYRPNTLIPSGLAYFGGYDASGAAGPFSQYPVVLDTAQWSYQLESIQVGSSNLGRNGLVTVDTGSQYSVVPMNTFNLMLQQIFPANVVLTRTSTPSYDYVTFNCSESAYPNMPNITYSLEGVPLVLTAYQYVEYVSSNACVMTIVGTAPNTLYPAPYTLGTLSFNGTLSVFNLGNRTLSIAPLAIP